MSRTNAITAQAHKLIDTPELAAEAIAELYQLPDLYKLPPSLYIDVKGVNVSRSGKIFLIQIHISTNSENMTYVFDVYQLGDQIFDIPVAEGSNRSLRAILTSPHIPKALFDCRRVNDALHNLFDIYLAGVHDIQLMELASRIQFPKPHNSQYIHGLQKVIDGNGRLSQQEEQRRSHFQNSGGNLVFRNRPLDPFTLGCSLQDVVLFPRLWRRFNAYLSANWKPKVNKAVLDRLDLAHGEQSTAQGGKEMALGPAEWYDPKGPQNSQDKSHMTPDKRKTAAPKNMTKRYLDEDSS